MRRLAILAALATAPASVASAQPLPPPDYEPYDQPYGSPNNQCDCNQCLYSCGYYSGRYGYGYGYPSQAPYQGYYQGWTPLAQQTSATSERQFVNVLGRGGYYQQLLVQGVRDAPMIERVAVEFENRQTQVWDVHQQLPRGASEVIDLGGPKRIHRIIVYTDPSYGGSYSVFAA